MKTDDDELTPEQKVSLAWVEANPGQNSFTIPQHIRIPFQYLNKYNYISFTEKTGWIIKVIKKT